MVVITIFILILAYSLPFFKNTISSTMFRRICAISFIYASVLAYNTLNFQAIGSGIGLYSGLFQVNILSNLISFFILIISSLILFIWPNLSFLRAKISAKGEEENLNKAMIKYHYINNNTKSNEYCLVILFNILGALFLISSSDLISMYLSIELQSFGLYILASLYKEKYSSTSAGLKYFLLGGLSSCIILLGSGLIYSYTGLTNLESIYSLISVITRVLENDNLNNLLIYSNELKGISIGILFIFAGFLFKIAASPFHNWAPDVYDESPTLVTIWLTIMPKISILILLLGLQIGVDLNLNFTLLTPIYYADNSISNISVNVLTNLLLLSSLLSLIIGSIVGLSQIRIKRLLAYSTISHVGFLLLSLSVFSNASIEAFIFYIIQYTITNLNIFLIILAFGYIYRINMLKKPSIYQLQRIKGLNIIKPRENNHSPSAEYNLSDIEYISSFKGLFYKNPVLSISLSICLFSFAGVPPLIGFFAKQQVLYSSNSAGYFFLSLIAILVSVISAFYYLKIIKILLTYDNSAVAVGEEKNKPYTILNNNKVLTSSDQTLNILTTDQKNDHEWKLEKGWNQTIRKILIENYDNNYITTIHSYIISILTLIILFFILNPELLLNCIAIITSLILNL